jgi:hypothetical protein
MMAEYRLLAMPNLVQHVVPGELVVTFPLAPGNSDYEKYQAWLADGGVPDPVPAPISPALNSVGTGKTTNEILGVADVSA